MYICGRWSTSMQQSNAYRFNLSGRYTCFLVMCWKLSWRPSAFYAVLPRGRVWLHYCNYEMLRLSYTIRVTPVQSIGRFVSDDWASLSITLVTELRLVCRHRAVRLRSIKLLNFSSDRRAAWCMNEQMNEWMDGLSESAICTRTCVHLSWQLAGWAV